MTNLAPCPCGEVPEKLCISDSNGLWAYVSGYCCGEWNIEFRADYLPHGDPELVMLAEKAWNLARRAATRTCEWHEDGGGWHSACHGSWGFEEGGTPFENDIKYCHSCGAKVVVKPEDTQ